MKNIWRRLIHGQKLSDRWIGCFVILSWLLMLILVLFVIFASVEHRTHEEFKNQQQVELINMIQNFLSNRSAIKNQPLIVSTMNPTIEYEQLRRRIRSNIIEMYNFIDSELSSIMEKHDNFSDHIVNVMETTTELKHFLLNDIDEWRKLDGFEQQRYNEAKQLSNLVQSRLMYLQNPTNCSTTPVTCSINRPCGFGCELHNTIFCFIMAYATETSFILKSRSWRYNRNGWVDIFKPLSKTCLRTDRVNLKIVRYSLLKPPQSPRAIPEDLSSRLQRLHGDPLAWWVGQFLKYMLRLQPKTQAIIEASTRKLGFKSPIVGVHIRRTDKIRREAALHHLEQYIDYVDEYYEQMEMIKSIDKRRIYLATDDPMVFEEAREKYPHYEIIGDSDVARVAAPATRYSTESLYGILVDVHHLAMSDYLVCTFSSTICRMAYELMQTMHPDAAHRFKSLDDTYFFPGQWPHFHEAILPHNPLNRTNEIQIQVGDLIFVAGNHWNGFLMGRNKRTNQTGLFPSFKVVDKIVTAKFPLYSNVKVEDFIDYSYS